jgi:hypothetical protein
MYPLNMSLIEGVGFACANSEQEHKALSDAGYGPAFAGDMPEESRTNTGQIPEIAGPAPGQEEKRKPGRPKKAE